MSGPRPDWDVIGIGAGLAGLTAALELARRGRRVLVLERRAEPGGLCGTWRQEEFEFAIACNDFGAGLARIMRRLGVPARFRRTRTEFHLADRVVRVPPALGAIGGWLRWTPDALRLLRAARGGTHETLAPLVRESVRDPGLADFVNGLAYPMGVAPERLRLEAVAAELSREHRYGYHRPCTPLGGPRALVDAMVRRLRELGGRIELGVEASSVRKQGPHQLVRTEAGELAARAVVTSQGRWDRYPARLEPGLAVSMLLLGLRGPLRLPEGVHTVVSFPPRVADWMAALDSGEWPQASGFHLFRNNSSRPEAQSVSVYFFLPRGLEDPTRDQAERVETAVLAAAERILPGLGAKISYRHFLSPKSFRETHGLSSRATPFVLEPGFVKPDAYDSRTGLVHVGSSVRPAGEHAGQALLSGLQAAAHVEAMLDAE